MAAPKHSYLVLSEDATSHSVFVKYAALPGLLQHIGTFRDKDRAESYAEIENSFCDDDLYEAPDIVLPKDLPAAPASALPQVLGTTLQAAKTTAIEAFVDQIIAENPVAAPVPPAPVTGTWMSADGTIGVLHDEPAAPPSEEPEADLTPAVQALLARPEKGEERNSAVLQVIRDLTATGSKITYRALTERLGFTAPTLSVVLTTLKARGLVVVLKPGDPGVDADDVIARGGIRLADGPRADTAGGVAPVAVPVAAPVAKVELRKAKATFRDEIAEMPARHVAEPSPPPEPVTQSESNRPAVVRGLKSGPLPPAPTARTSKFNNFSQWRAKPVPLQAGAKIETPEEFLARGGHVTKAPDGHAGGTGDGIVGVTVRPKHGY